MGIVKINTEFLFPLYENWINETTRYKRYRENNFNILYKFINIYIVNFTVIFIPRARVRLRVV